MAQPAVVDSRLCRVWLYSKPGQTTAPVSVLICALTTKGFNQTKNMNTAVIPDCDDPTIVAPVKRTPISLDATISGEGYYQPNLRSTIQSLFDASTSEIVCFEIGNGEAATSVAGYYSGKFFLTSLNITADEGQYVRAAMTWEVDGDWNWHPQPFARATAAHDGTIPPEDEPPEPSELPPPELLQPDERQAETA